MNRGESSRVEITTSFADVMKGLHKFAFGPFGENTYLVEVSPTEAVVVDPGMSNAAERSAFDAALAGTGCQLVAVLLTHAHLDHVAGLGHIHEVHGLVPRMHRADEGTYRQAPLAANLHGFPMDALPEEVRCHLVHGMSLGWSATTL